MLAAVVLAVVAMAIPGLQEGLVLAVPVVSMAHGRLVLAAAVVARLHLTPEPKSRIYTKQFSLIIVLCSFLFH